MPSYVFRPLPVGYTATVYPLTGSVRGSSAGTGVVDATGTLTITLPVGNYEAEVVKGQYNPVAGGELAARPDPEDVLTRTEAGVTSNLLTVGDETFLRDLLSSSDRATGTGVLRLTFWTARKTEAGTSSRTLSGGTAAAATPTLCQVGVYSVDAAGAGTLVASTPNDVTLWAAQHTDYTKAFSVPFAKVAGQRYATGVLVVTAAAAPTMWGCIGDGNPGTRNEAAKSPRLAGSISSLAALPASFTDAGLTAQAHRTYSVVLP